MAGSAKCTAQESSFRKHCSDMRETRVSLESQFIHLDVNPTIPPPIESPKQF